MNRDTNMTRPLRVALLCHYPADEVAPSGGVFAVGRNLAAGMVAAGAEVHVVRYRGGEKQPATIASHDGRLTIHSVALPAGPLPKSFTCVASLAAKVAGIRPDAVSAHAPEYALAGLRSGYPTAVTIHGIVRREFQVFRGWRSRLPLLLSVWQDWQVARRAGQIVAINEYVISQYRSRTRAEFQRIDVPIGDVFFAAPAREPDPHTLLLVGGMSERKDPLPLLQVLVRLRGRLPDVQLRIAGPLRREGFGQKLQRFITDAGLTGNVQFLGSLNQPELAEAYAASALTVLSSRQETSPAVLMEAMAARRPVVATRVGGVDEIVVDGESGFVTQPGDVAALAECVETVLNDPALARRMGLRGRELAEARYRRNLVGRQYIQLLERLAQGRRS